LLRAITLGGAGSHRMDFLLGGNRRFLVQRLFH
jgi:hypothetical protein